MHFNATNIHVMVNDQWLNDACSISWQQQGGVEPLWGYMDDRFRDVARVSNLIVGTLGIYFRDHDRFFRYLAGGAGGDAEARRSDIDKAKEAVKAAIRAGTLATLLASVALDSPEWALLSQEAMKIHQVEVPEDPSALAEDSDVVGRSGFDQLLRKTSTSPDSKQRRGATIDIFLGDGPDQVKERLHGVWITGRARSPVENSPQTGAQPLMEYYSFIANCIGRTLPTRRS